METKSYQKLGITLTVSFFIMYAVMFLNVDSPDHVYWSATRLYMALLMIAPMALLMILSMKKMYTNKKINVFIMIGSTTLFFLCLFLLRTQTFVDDTQYMKAMIPHHSSAIMTSRHATIQDPELKTLSESIIKGQEKEIRQMKSILERLNKR